MTHYRHSGMPEEEYFRLDALNSSLLKLMGRSPAHCRAAMVKTLHKESEALRMGRIIHAAVLEPERFASEYCETPRAELTGALNDLASYKVVAKDLGLKVGGSKADLKARILEIEPETQFADDVNQQLTAGREPLKPEQWEMVTGIAEAIEANPSARGSFSNGIAEETLVWIDQETGTRCKSRMDYYHEESGIVVDLKTCEDARIAAVTRDIVRYGYHKSAAHYLNGLKAANLPGDNFAWIFVEKTRPYAISAYFAAPDMLEQGTSDMRRHLNDYAQCKNSGVWPAYSLDFQTINLPEWAQE